MSDRFDEIARKLHGCCLCLRSGDECRKADEIAHALRTVAPDLVVENLRLRDRIKKDCEDAGCGEDSCRHDVVLDPRKAKEK